MFSNWYPLSMCITTPLQQVHLTLAESSSYISAVIHFNHSWLTESAFSFYNTKHVKGLLKVLPLCSRSASDEFLHTKAKVWILFNAHNCIKNVIGFMSELNYPDSVTRTESYVPGLLQKSFPLQKRKHVVSSHCINHGNCSAEVALALIVAWLHYAFLKNHLNWCDKCSNHL